MAIHSAAITVFEDTGTDAELGAIRAALACASEAAPNEREQRKEAFLVALRDYPRRVAAVAIIGCTPGQPEALDEVWVFWPDRPWTRHDRGEAFRKTEAAIRIQAEGDALLADIIQRVERIAA